MFTNKNKIIKDKGYRFQNTKFRHQLNNQRNYKRRGEPLPNGTLDKLLSKIGLGSWYARGISFIVLAALVYLFYIPNPLYIKTVAITGADDQAINNTVNVFLEKKVPWPQKNLLLLSSKSLKNFVLTNNKKVLSVNSVRKKFPNTLLLDITPRVDKFIVIAENGIFTAYGDGYVSSMLSENINATSVPTNLIKIKLKSDTKLFAGQKVFEKSAADFILQIQDAVIANFPADHFEYHSPPANSLIYLSQNKVRILFDYTANLQELLERYKLLLSQIGSQDIPKLEYINLRYKDKGYLCFKDAPCAKQTVLLPETASSSPENLNTN